MIPGSANPALKSWTFFSFILFVQVYPLSYCCEERQRQNHPDSEPLWDASQQSLALTSSQLSQSASGSQSVETGAVPKAEAARASSQASLTGAWGYSYCWATSCQVNLILDHSCF